VHLFEDAFFLGLAVGKRASRPENIFVERYVSVRVAEATDNPQNREESFHHSVAGG